MPLVLYPINFQKLAVQRDFRKKRWDKKSPPYTRRGKEKGKKNKKKYLY